MGLKHDILDLNTDGQDELFISTVTSVSRTVDTLRVTRYFSMHRNPRAYAVSCVLPVSDWDAVRRIIRGAHKNITANKPSEPIYGCTYYC